MPFDIKQKLTGAQLAGGNPSAGYRTENDFYATDPQAVNDLFNALSKYDPDFNNFSPRTFLEPCVGNGNIAKATTDYFLFSLKRNENSQCTFIDLVDRGYPNTKVQDFLLFESMQPQTKFDLIVSNPPYSLALEFVQKSLQHLSDHGYLAFFLKIQFWEGEKRKQFLLDNPPAFCFPFAKRMPTWNNGQPTDEHGKRWATTMCHAWFVWTNENQELCKTVPI